MSAVCGVNNREFHYATICGKRVKTAAHARMEKRLKGSAFIRALFDQPPTPCEMGCKYVEKCKKELLACSKFAMYVDEYLEAPSVSGYEQIPSKEMYEWIYSKEKRRGWPPFIGEDDLCER